MLYLFSTFLLIGLSSIVSTDAFSAVPSNNPVLSREEVQSLLDTVPVYAVTESQTGGIVLASEKDNENNNEIAYFFFNPKTANSVFAPLRKKDDDSSWDVSQFSLGLVWFELFQSAEKNGVDYRLVPDTRELAEAQKILSPDDAEPTDYFRSAYNEIPVFVDLSLRVQGGDGGKKLPMYFSLQDLIDSCQQADASESYEPTINVSNFCTLVEQMQAESDMDFRNVVMVPPSQLLSPDDSNSIQADAKDEPITIPTSTDSWDD
mmetsp:Transcript_12652/g.26926  ORF Transcript_12652/g.26926 Transcript_12652/m.26926 type:complete len:262 (-) Transcript_12652:253-1038(-)